MSETYLHLYACFVLVGGTGDAWKLYICDTDALQRIGLDPHAYVSAAAFDGSRLPDWAMIEADRGEGFASLAVAMCEVLRPDTSEFSRMRQ